MHLFKEIRSSNTLQKLQNFNQTVAKASIAIDSAPSVDQQLKEEQHKDTELLFQYKQEVPTTKTRPRQTLIENHHRRSKKNQNKFQRFLKKKHL